MPLTQKMLLDKIRQAVKDQEYEDDHGVGLSTATDGEIDAYAKIKRLLAETADLEDVA